MKSFDAFIRVNIEVIRFTGVLLMANKTYIQSLSLSHIRNISDLQLSLMHDAQPRMRTLIIGHNGAGKTSLLRAIALGMGTVHDVEALLAENIGQIPANDASNASVEVKTTSGLRELHFDKPNYGIKIDGPRSFICAYGAGRAIEGSKGVSAYKYRDAVLNLFRYEAPLIDPELALRRLNDFMGEDRYERMMSGIKRALDLTLEDNIFLPKGGGVQIKGPTVGGPVPLQAWADGYRRTIGWILDLYSWAMKYDDAWDQERDIVGVLLLDEIEQHLHPSMQTGLMDRLSVLFPKLQIIATTHSPLVALGCKSHEVISLHTENGRVIAETDLPGFEGCSAEDILEDKKMFDTRAVTPEHQEKLARYHALIGIPQDQRSDEDRSELIRLARQVSADTPISGSNPVLDELRKISQSLGV